MKKSPIKEFIITSVAAAVAGFVVKKGYEYFLDAGKNSSKKKKSDTRLLPVKASETLEDTSQKIGQTINQGSPAEKGLVATLAYTMTAFMVSKFLRRVI